jgi:hypothetical protein
MKHSEQECDRLVRLLGHRMHMRMAVQVLAQKPLQRCLRFDERFTEPDQRRFLVARTSSIVSMPASRMAASLLSDADPSPACQSCGARLHWQV